MTNTRKLFPLRMSETEHAQFEATAKVLQVSMNAFIVSAALMAQADLAKRLGMSYPEYLKYLDTQREE